jgi:hypothetical protein
MKHRFSRHLGAANITVEEFREQSNMHTGNGEDHELWIDVKYQTIPWKLVGRAILTSRHFIDLLH